MRRLLQRVGLYGFHVCIARPVLHWLIGVRFRRRNLVPDGPCLVVSNHNSHLDAAVLMTLFPLRRLARVHPVAAADYFGSTWFRRTMALALMNGIPIERQPLRAQDPLGPIVRALEAGETLIFFPEGSRGEAGVVAPFRPGIGVLVRSVPGLLVVPVFLSGPERIWARGHKVPVPLSIDVNVGRPRAYSHTEDARRIAERVRHDVLALAPPPPPVPGLRPAPPLRVAICGADPERRRAALVRITERLGRLGRAVALGSPGIDADSRGAREVRDPVPPARGRAWLYVLARLLRTREPYRGEGFVELVEGIWVDEALERSAEIRFVVDDHSALVELLARAARDPGTGAGTEDTNRVLQYLISQKRIPAARWWSTVRRMPEIWLLNVLDLARPRIPRLLVHLDRPHADDPHGLRRSYRAAVGALGKRRGVEVLEVDGTKVGNTELSERVEEVCRRLLGEAEAATPER